MGKFWDQPFVEQNLGTFGTDKDKGKVVPVLN